MAAAVTRRVCCNRVTSVDHPVRIVSAIETGGSRPSHCDDRYNDNKDANSGRNAVR
jgi:hypothetical protein